MWWSPCLRTLLRVNWSYYTSASALIQAAFCRKGTSTISSKNAALITHFSVANLNQHIKQNLLTHWAKATRFRLKATREPHTTFRFSCSLVILPHTFRVSLAFKLRKMLLCTLLTPLSAIGTLSIDKHTNNFKQVQFQLATPTLRTSISTQFDPTHQVNKYQVWNVTHTHIHTHTHTHTTQLPMYKTSQRTPIIMKKTW